MILSNQTLVLNFPHVCIQIKELPARRKKKIKYNYLGCWNLKLKYTINII